MRSRMLLGLLVVAAAATVGSVQAAQLATRRAHNTVRSRIRLPAPGHWQLSLLTVKVTAPKGEQVGPLGFREINRAQLSKDKVRVAEAITPRSSQKQDVTFKVFVLILRGRAATGHIVRDNNFSRIDNVELIFDLQEQLTDETVTVITFGRNYNIFKYTEGLGGLAFAN